MLCSPDVSVETRKVEAAAALLANSDETAMRLLMAIPHVFMIVRDAPPEGYVAFNIEAY